MKIEKNPGPDWSVVYQFGDDEPQLMAVFGQETVEDALKEAHYSLKAPGLEDAEPYKILGVIRQDCVL
jgi:hypothetical protein